MQGYQYTCLENNEGNGKLVETYSFQCYVTSIAKPIHEEGFEYHVKYNSSTYEGLINFHRFEKEVKSLLEDFVMQQKDFCTFNQLYKYISEIVFEKALFPEKFLIPILSRTLNLEKLMPLLIDDEIDEIYLDKSEKSLYLDHSRYGRCTTRIGLSKAEIESFIHRVALENDFSLNQSNPTMKCDFLSPLFHTRVTVDIPPLIIDDFHIDIRKFHSDRLRLFDLVRIKSLTWIQAFFLAYLIQNQVSISILGPPNSGKTTLQNALIEYIPSHLRLLSVEDVLELSNARQGNSIRFRLGYDPYESMLITKSLEIQKILHRSPDFINLGELSSENHFKAFLNVLSVGVSSIQTIHGKNPEYLVGRLRDVYNIPLELFKTSFPHVFVELNVSWIGNKKKREVVGISELTDSGNIIVLPNDVIESFISNPSNNPKIFTLKHIFERKKFNSEYISKNIRKLSNEFQSIINNNKMPQLDISDQNNLGS